MQPSLSEQLSLLPVSSPAFPQRLDHVAASDFAFGGEACQTAPSPAPSEPANA